MEIRTLRYFITVAQEESISRAAEVLHITQPTLSRQLAQMEQEMGVRLFERGPRKITLTSEGKLLRRRAEEIISLVDKTQRELSEQEELAGGCITVGCGELAAVAVLSRLFRDFHQRYPQVSFDLFTANADLVKEQIDKGLVDVGLLLEPIDVERYDFIRLDVLEKWGALLPPDHPLAQQPSVSAKELEELPLIFPRRPGVQSELASWFGETYERLNILFTSNLSTNSGMMVDAGLGVALTVEGSLPFLDRERLLFRPLFPELSATSVLAWKRQQPLSPAAARFIAFARCFLSMKSR